ncbi:hypothetical protein BKA61DRAFT_602073 [Leptodontidium sp. MPI-SDFR-AT-0119]|nr:hypothetical protein BKA61DRAFT_602073 [Leptodontidium sp. MPI-SDFR-AT-0119]
MSKRNIWIDREIGKCSDKKVVIYWMCCLKVMFVRVVDLALAMRVRARWLIATFLVLTAICWAAVASLVYSLRCLTPLEATCTCECGGVVKVGKYWKFSLAATSRNE